MIIQKLKQLSDHSIHNLLVFQHCFIQISHLHLAKVISMANLNLAVSRVLHSFTEKYKADPNRMYDIGAILAEHGFNYAPIDFGKELQNLGYIKDFQFSGPPFYAYITVSGIEKGDPDYFKHYQEQIIQHFCLMGNQTDDIMEILQFAPNHYQRARDIVNYLETNGILTDVLYGQNIAMARLTLRGQDLCPDGGFID